MKYEMIFGDEKLFDGAPDDAIFVIRDDNGCFIYGYAIKTRFNFMSESKSFGVAMRRIIKEPKRWTAEDKNAGLLPDVGCEYIGRDVLLTCVFVDKNRDVWGKSKDNLMHCHDYSEIKPIETPEEKAARLCNEWCKTAADIFVRHPSISGTESMGGIYKAMLSGDLPVPGKEQL